MKNKLPFSYVEISKKNLVHNIKSFRGLVKKGVKISAVIKGNAYGHGQNEVAKVLEPYVDYFQINSVEELELLRKVSKKKVLLLGYVQKVDLSRALKLGCIMTVFSIQELEKINKITRKLKIKQEVHMPIDAHLGREGFLEKDWSEVFKELQKYKNVKLGGLYAHFANIEDTKDFSHAQKQIDTYKRAVVLAESFNFKNLDTHISATSGILIYDKNFGLHSIVRLGIGLYGMWPAEHIQKIYKEKINLKPVLTWKTKVAQVKNLPKGASIGYGLTYITPKEMKVAVIPQGYADGLDRRMSSNGEVLIKGKRCKILGRMMMNMFVVDVNHIKNIKEGEEVVILGRQGKEDIRAEEIAENIGTINYEITTHINSLLPKIIV
ncbi:MAG: Alanine racemase [Patescibacteria group bacterium]|nr:Alanine racemase [Patescibacteria group bacterium]